MYRGKQPSLRRNTGQAVAYRIRATHHILEMFSGVEGLQRMMETVWRTDGWRT